ncbi:anti-sigma factor domain-containing protein [Solibacillus sp. FSL W7-1472]|uniref:anti-sigma factor domain-containing protein n=1 Tax=Solibacillus sp. FSL W7-1472 TaxID=2921707 RepID=UPI0030DAAF62
MRTYRGVVFEIEKKYTVFLTEKGEFLRGIPIGGPPNIGDEVDFHLINTPSLFSGRVKPRLCGTVMIAAVLLLSIVASLIPMGDEVMAYVQLESDTAMELGINELGEVIVLRYLNGTSVETKKSPDHWIGDSISNVLDTALKKLTAKGISEQVNITIIYENSKNQQKVQKIVGNAVRDVQSANKELTMKIGESTAEERAMANMQEMSVYKFKESQQVNPAKEIKPSSEIDEDRKNNPANEQREMETPINKEPISSVPANEKVNRNENAKESSGNKVQKSNGTVEKPIMEQKEKTKETPVEKGKSSHPEPGNGNSNKGQSPAPQQPKENKNEQKQSENDNSANAASKNKDQPNSP